MDGINNARITSEQCPEPAPRNCPAALNKSNAAVMDTPAISTRQPPDGHEFPDCVERMKNVPLAKPRATATPNVKSMIAMFSSPSASIADGGGGDTPAKPVLIPSSFQPAHSATLKRASLNLISPSSSPLAERQHARSQSLIDLSDALSLPATDRWSQLLEQRRRGLSKLKGLVISEHPDADTRAIDLPEIRSVPDAFTVALQSPILPPPPPPNQRPAARPSGLIAPLWDVPEAAKYSPAFKRKSLQIVGKQKAVTPSPEVDDESRILGRDTSLSLSEAPKSLESITSPTRSDSSFEYISSSSPELLKSASTTTTVHCNRRSRDALKKGLEDESDNDSALSSSQSSYVSRHSPRASPNHLNDHQIPEPGDLPNRRLLKAQSVEAINRKNILASAKCRSGRDFNGGSPLIQRKFDDAGQVGEAKEAASGNGPEDQPKQPQLSAVMLNGCGQLSEITPNPPRTCLGARTHAENKFSSVRMQNTKQASVTDLRRNFEKAAILSVGAKAPEGHPVGGIPNARSFPNFANNRTKRHSLPALPSAISSAPPKVLGSNEVEQIVQKTMAEWSNDALHSDELKVVALRPDIPGSSVGITLAGGTDYETKDITIHKVRSGSAAHRDGRLQKGDRILAINGTCMLGLTHAQSLAVLKEPVADTILVAYPGRTPATPTTLSRSASLFDMSPTGITSNAIESTNKDTLNKWPKSNKVNHIVVKLMKDAASGLGFSMEGGKDSPQGDMPLLIKKLFTGGIAEKCGQLEIGDEVLEINGIDVAGMSRIDTWSLIKKIPPGEVVLRVQRR